MSVQRLVEKNRFSEIGITSCRVSNRQQNARAITVEYSLLARSTVNVVCMVAIALSISKWMVNF